MKMLKKIIKFLCVLTIIFASNNICYSASDRVIVTGRAEIIGKNIDAARNKALADAFRNAVEVGLGVWTKSESEVKDATLVKDEILTRAEGYVIDHEIVKEGHESGFYYITISAKVAIDKIGTDFKRLVGRVKTAMGNPSITFVLTTWEKIGLKGSNSEMSINYESESRREKIDTEESLDAKKGSDTYDALSTDEKFAGKGASSQKVSVKASLASDRRGKSSVILSGRTSESDEKFDGSVDASETLDYTENANVQLNSSQSNSVKSTVSYSGEVKRKSLDYQSYKMKDQKETSTSTDNFRKTAKSSNYQKIDEKLWKKYPDMTIIDAFQQEFKNKNFDLKATDKAREIALAESLAKTSVDPSDRKAVREEAEKEGANFVARGEAKILDIQQSENTGNFEVTAQVNVEIIDVNSGDIVASYTNTASASNKSEANARVQSIKKIAVLAARTLADQTISTWQERSLSGRQYSIEIRNIKSMRKQKKPIMDAVEAIAQIVSQTSPQDGVLLLNVLYKGDKRKLGDQIMEQLETKPGFSENEFDGPFDEGGKIVFKFKI